MKLSSGLTHITHGGSESGECILFIHGLGGNSTNFEPLISASGVDKTHRIITFDLEGHGLTPLSGTELTVASFAESAKEVLDNAGVKSAIVIGHSMGGVRSIPKRFVS